MIPGFTADFSGEDYSQEQKRKIVRSFLRRVEIHYGLPYKSLYLRGRNGRAIRNLNGKNLSDIRMAAYKVARDYFPALCDDVMAEAFEVDRTTIIYYRQTGMDFWMVDDERFMEAWRKCHSCWPSVSELLTLV